MGGAGWEQRGQQHREKAGQEKEKEQQQQQQQQLLATTADRKQWFGTSPFCSLDSCGTEVFDSFDSLDLGNDEWDATGRPSLQPVAHAHAQRKLLDSNSDSGDCQLCERDSDFEYVYCEE